MPKNDSLYSIKSVCRLTGLRAPTLHAWEKRYKAVEPRRTTSLHRVYSENDIEKLRLLVSATGLGHSIRNIAHLSVPQLALLLGGSQTEAPDFLPAPEIKKPKPSIAVFCRRILQAAQDFELDRLHEELWLAQNQGEPQAFVLEVLVPLFAQMAKAVQSGKLSVAQEHVLSSVIKSSVLTENWRQRLSQNRTPNLQITRRIILTTFDGDYHEFGITLAAMLCAEHQHIVHLMGPSLPPASVVEAVNRLRADVLILASPKPSYDELAQHPRDYLQELSPRLPKLCELWIGGDDASFLVPSNLARKVVYLRSLHDLQKHLVQMELARPGLTGCGVARK